MFGGRPFTQARADVLGAIAARVPIYRAERPDLDAATRFVSGLLEAADPD